MKPHTVQIAAVIVALGFAIAQTESLAQPKVECPEPLICSSAPAIRLTVQNKHAPRAQEPLHKRIDSLIEASQQGPIAGVTFDAEFLRRIYLDLVGSIPSTTELRTFLSDQGPDKREKVISQLVSSKRFARHMATVFSVMLMERRVDKYIKAPEFWQFLYTSFEQNKPYNQLARELLAADGATPALRPAVKFYIDRNGAEVNILTRDVGRIFFGVDFQCCQCHDHPLIDNYLQSDYFGIYAALNRGFLFTDKKKKVSYAEKAIGGASYKSVFTGDSGKTLARLPGGAELPEPRFRKGDEYKVKAAKNVRPIPKFSRRTLFATEATNGRNVAFNRNIVNRLWAQMMGRGLVHPVDLHHPDNPPSHPQLLDLLAREFVQMKFDVKALIQELALTRTYQRSFEMPSGISEFAATAKTPIQALKQQLEQLQTELAKSEKAAEALSDKHNEALKTMTPIEAELGKANTAITAAKKVSDAASKAAAAIQKQLATKQDVAKSVSQVSTQAAAVLKKLPKDKELADATAKFAARSKQLAAEATAIQKQYDGKNAVAKTAADKLESAHQAADAIGKKLDVAQKPISKLDAEFVTATAKRKTDLAAANEMETRIELLESAVAYRELLVKIAEEQKTIVKLQATIDTEALAVKKVEDELVELTSMVAGAGKAVSIAQQSVAGAEKIASSKRATVAAVGEVVSKSVAALQKLPQQDAALKQVIEKLQSRKKRFSQEVATADQLVKKQNVEVSATLVRLTAAKKRLTTANEQVKLLRAQLGQSQQKLAAAQTQVSNAKLAADVSFQTVTEHWTRRFAAFPLTALQPEQLAWSVMQALGVVDKQRSASIAEINKKDPKGAAAAKADPVKQKARDVQIEKAVHAKLLAQVAIFVKLFGGGAGQPQDEFFATVDQALFFANGSQVQGWLTPGAGNLTDRLNKLNDPTAFADELYVSVLSRQPTTAEIADAKGYLARRAKDRPAAVREIVWALVTSAEFRFNH